MSVGFQIEPHIALRIAEHSLRLALADELEDIKAVAQGNSLI